MKENSASTIPEGFSFESRFASGLTHSALEKWISKEKSKRNSNNSSRRPIATLLLQFYT